MFDLQGFGALLLSGATVTIQLAVTSLMIGLVLGLLGATAKISNIWLLRKLATVYTATMRGIPELLLVLFIYYGGSILLMSILKKFGYNDYVEISAFWGGVMALSIAFGAYATEIFRMAIQEIPIGQKEASQAIGMRPFQTFYRITLPQVWQIALPGLGNLGLLAQKYDAVIAGMSITAERQEKVDFSEPYFANTMVWLTNNDGSFDPMAIQNVTLGGQRSTTPGAYLQDNYEGKDGNTVQLYDNYDNAYLDLKSGRSDAVLAEKVSAKSWLADNKEGFGVVGDEIDNDDNIAIAVRKGDPLKAEFDKALSEIRSNGELARLEQQNFGQ